MIVPKMRHPINAHVMLLSPVTAMVSTSKAIMPPLLPAAGRMLEPFSATIEHAIHAAHTTRSVQRTPFRPDRIRGVGSGGVSCPVSGCGCSVTGSGET